MASSLLSEADAILPVVRRRAAAGDIAALQWLMESAQAWARGEFVRRQARRHSPPDEWHWEERIYALRRHQVAVCVLRQGSVERSAVYTGFLRPASMVGYLDIEPWPGRSIAGMWDYLDIIELPPRWRVRAWPK